MHFPVLNKRNREFWENQAFWVPLLWGLLAEGKSDANFSISSLPLYICNFSEILMSNNSSIAIFPYSYILCLDGIILGRIVMESLSLYWLNITPGKSTSRI